MHSLPAANSLLRRSVSDDRIWKNEPRLWCFELSKGIFRPRPAMILGLKTLTLSARTLNVWELTVECQKMKRVRVRVRAENRNRNSSSNDLMTSV